MELYWRSANCVSTSGMRNNGSATLSGNSYEAVAPINLWNIDKPLRQDCAQQLSWSALTTGGFGGADILLADAKAGLLKIDTGLVKADIAIADIGLQDRVLPTGGGIARQMRVFRLPDDNPATSARFERRIRRSHLAEDALYVCITLADGHRIWSSPTYLMR